MDMGGGRPTVAKFMLRVCGICIFHLCIASPPFGPRSSDLGHTHAECGFSIRPRPASSATAGVQGAGLQGGHPPNPTIHRSHDLRFQAPVHGTLFPFAGVPDQYQPSPHCSFDGPAFHTLLVLRPPFPRAVLLLARRHTTLEHYVFLRRHADLIY